MWTTSFGKATTCSRFINYGFSGTDSYAFRFGASDCGGILPSPNATAIVKTINACGGTGGFGVFNGLQSIATPKQGLVNGPGAWAYFTNPCTWPTGYQAHFEVVFVN